jgi:hypothetical protein
LGEIRLKLAPAGRRTRPGHQPQPSILL